MAENFAKEAPETGEAKQKDGAFQKESGKDFVDIIKTDGETGNDFADLLKDDADTGKDFVDALKEDAETGKDFTDLLKVDADTGKGFVDSLKDELPKDRVDVNGKPYMQDGKLLPNTTYELNGNVYTTDDKGRIISCEAKPKLTPDNPRDNAEQGKAGGEDRKPTDQGGHIVGRDLNGDPGLGNIVPMDSRINQSDYKRMENDVKKALSEGKEVTTKTELVYTGDSERPDKIITTVTVDGKDTVYTFDNNLDGSLMDKVKENGNQGDVNRVQDELDETGGQISSIKEEFDEDGNLEKTTIRITYTDENGVNHRENVVIDNSNGGTAS
jgi:hypothetical protein